tara:strand:+ start:5962 stop:6300 length:339 start_codon:yes stop_codon:yes gene_type:complete
MKKYNFSYDQENDDLFLFDPKSKSKGSIEFGDLILDFNSKKELVGIQMMNASKFLKDILDEDVDLRGLEECKVEVKVKNNLLLIKIGLFTKLKALNPVLTVPNIKERSPALY